ncbi:hypothetical protein B0H10DRAFT_720301 [Mycena sp. CBHHK59/15]|nr:hypothetical protein B0H10DRAFT_720301 [Mycena sp. CBHHK59/15]
MHQLALQHRMSGNVHSISDSFWTGTHVLQFLVVFLQSGHFEMNSSTSEAAVTNFSPDSPDSQYHFLHLQRVLPSFSHNAVVCEAVYAHSRLAILPGDTTSARVLRFGAAVGNTCIRLLESGNTGFNLRLDQAVEATLDNFLVWGVETRDVALCLREILVDGMINLCEEWLIMVRHVVSMVPDTALKLATVDMHKQYMLKLAVLEESAALIAGYRNCPWSGTAYEDITATAQKLVHELVDSITASIFGGESRADPSPRECCLAQELGRITGYWSLAYYLMDEESRKKQMTCGDWTASAVLLNSFSATRFQLSFEFNKRCSLDKAHLPQELWRTFRTTSPF